MTTHRVFEALAAAVVLTWSPSAIAQPATAPQQTNPPSATPIPGAQDDSTTDNAQRNNDDKAAGHEQPTASCPPNVKGDPFRYGDLNARAGCLNKLRELSAPPASSQEIAKAHEAVRLEARGLAEAYQQRSSRQQRFLDAASGVTVIGAIGAAASGNVSTNTQNNWIYGALAPVVLTQFNANEPTRDLFFAGGLGMDLITARYDGLVSAARRLKARYPAESQPPDGREAARPSRAGSSMDFSCQPAEATLDQVTAWTNVPGPRAVILADAQQVVDHCHALSGARGQIGVLVNAITAGGERWPAAFATDALGLDSALLAEDRDLRFTPLETVGAILASPFRAVDTLISGTDPQSDLKKIQTHEALSGISQTLTPINLPPVPDRVPDRILISDGARAQRSASTVPPAAGQISVGDALTDLAEAALILETERLALAQDIALVNEIALAAQLTELRFDYDITARLITVTLRKPSPEGPGLTSGATSATATPPPP